MNRRFRYRTPGINETRPYGEFISPSSDWIEIEPPRRIASGGSPLDIPTAKCYNNRQDAAKRQAVQSFRYGVPQKGGIAMDYTALILLIIILFLVKEIIRISNKKK